MHRPPRAALLTASLAAALVVAGCGGGGDGGAAAGGGASGLVASSSVAARCVAPRGAGIVDENGNRYPDVQGTVDDEKSWVRSWTDETYLWYRDVRALAATTLDPANAASARAYFNVLKSPLTAPSGKAQDAYHFYYDTPAWVALSRSGVSFGYGFEVAVLATTPPRRALIAYTVAGTPAAAAGIARGAEILAVDGVDNVNDGSSAGVAVLNAGLFPTAAGAHTFSMLDPGATVPRDVTLAASALATATVLNVQTLPAPNQAVGYLQFNDQLATSEAQLAAAITQLRGSGVTDLVLDMRYNGGGFLDIASELAYMIAGPGPTTGKVFEQDVFNDKNPFNLSPAQTATPFLGRAQGFSLPSGQVLPTLNLARVTLLVGAGTCSASESVVNSLRGVGVQVNLIGATTCGKPYGFFPRDNCGTTYFSILFRGVNQLGFGDYEDGFAPTCAASDDFGHALGDPNEGRLAAALSYLASGVCAPAMAIGQRARASASASASMGEPVLVRSALRENRIVTRH